MTTFLAFFDVLGFKEIVNKNSLGELDIIFDHLLRESQAAISAETYLQVDPGLLVPDIKNSKVNCLHISDSIVFWTQSDREEDFLELCSVSYTFYWRSLQLSIPLRGCMVHGEVSFKPFTIEGANGTKFQNLSLYGKGLVSAYTSADKLEFSGCYLDTSVLTKVEERTINNLIYDQILCLYKVPLKDGKASYEHVFRPIKGAHNEVSFRNGAVHLKSLFTYHSKMTELPDGVQSKLTNTIDFLEHFRETDPNLKRPN